MTVQNSQKFKFTLSSLTKALSGAGVSVLRDATCPGLIIRRTPAGKTWWALEKRIGGQLRKKVLWQWQENQSIDDARAECNRLILSYRAGEDPTEKQKADNVGRRTVSDWADRYIKSRELRASSIRQLWAHLRALNVGQRPLLPFTVDEARELFSSQLGGVLPATAVKRLSSLRILWAWASQGTDWESKPNPFKVATKGISRHKPRTRHIELAQCPAFIETLRQFPNSGGRLMECLLLTGCRLNELRELTWEEVGTEAKWISLPAARVKTKNTFSRPLGRRVQEILRQQRKLGSHWVFPGDSGINPTTAHRLSGTVAGTAATGAMISAHDLRRSFISAGHRSGVSPELVRALVNHSPSDVHGAYFQASKSALEEAAQRIEDYILAGGTNG